MLLSSRRRAAASKGVGMDAASSDDTGCGFRKPRIQSLRSCLIFKLHTLFLAPGSADVVFSSLSGYNELSESVVMEVGRFRMTGVQEFLKEHFMVSAKSFGKPSPKKLRPWLGNTRINVHCNFKEALLRAWSDSTGCNGSEAA